MPKKPDQRLPEVETERHVYIEPPPAKPDSKEELRLMPVLVTTKDEEGKIKIVGPQKKWLNKKQATDEGLYWKD